MLTRPPDRLPKDLAVARSASPKKPAKKKVAKKSAKNSAATTAVKKKGAKPAAKSTKAKAKPKARDAGEEKVTVDRRRAERRDGEAAENSSSKKAPAAKLERREKVNRRRQIDPTTCERDYSDCEVEFMNALDEYKRKSGRMFPTCSEVLEVVRDLGYVQLTAAEKAAREALAVESDPAAVEDARAESEVERALELSEEVRFEDEEDSED